MIGYKICITLFAVANFTLGYLHWSFDSHDSTAPLPFATEVTIQPQTLDTGDPSASSIFAALPPSDVDRAQANIAEMLFSDALVKCLNIPIRAYDGTEIHPELVELFDLSEPERLAFRDCLDRFSLRLQELRLDHATLSEIKGSKLRLTIDPLAATGKLAYDSFIDDLEHAIDPTKAQIFGQIGKNSVHDLFKSLGEKPVRYEIERVHQEDHDEEPAFSLTRHFKDGEFSHQDQRQGTLEDLERIYPGIPSLFPPEKLAELPSPETTQPAN